MFCCLLLNLKSEFEIIKDIMSLKLWTNVVIKGA